MGGTTLQAPPLNLKIQGRFFISLIATCLISKGESEVETKKKIKPRAIVATHADDCLVELLVSDFSWGSTATIKWTGPSVLLAYALAGLILYLVMRALGGNALC